MRVLILGCGIIGDLVGSALAADGADVIGVRRRARPTHHERFTMVTGDISDPTLYDALDQAMPSVDAVLLAANPGVRRGVDNGVARAAALLVQRHPHARIVYTATTSVYGDAAGGGVDEETPIDRSKPSNAALMAIEDAIVRASDAVILRATALVGPQRTFSRDRLLKAAEAKEPCVIAGDLSRPFSYLHERDLAQCCMYAMQKKLPAGLFNAASPERLTIGDYYTSIARHHGIACDIVGDETQQPARWIDASRLHAQLPAYAWRKLFTDQ